MFFGERVRQQELADLKSQGGSNQTARGTQLITPAPPHPPKKNYAPTSIVGHDLSFETSAI